MTRSGADQRVGWTQRVGAWLGIGASPAALVLGAGLALRHGGPIPAWTIAAAAILLIPLLAGAGILGLAKPIGENATLSRLLPEYVDRASERFLMGLIAAAMIGWFGFHVGLGGAAVSSLLDTPAYMGPVLLGVPIAALSHSGIRQWNPVAIVAMTSALVLAGLIGLQVGFSQPPIDLGRPHLTTSLSDLAGFVGYVAVFSVRGPDFTAGLATKRDLGWCIASLVVPLILLTLIGIALGRQQGTADLVAMLTASGGNLGRLLIAVAVIGAAFTTTHSGSLAVASLSPVRRAPAVWIIALPGLGLAIARFDLLLLAWLGVLAAAIPPLVVPLAVEGARRRRGRSRETIPAWTWIPASLTAVVLTSAGVKTAPLSGIALACLTTFAWRMVKRDASGSD